MFVALDSKGNRVYAEYATRDQKYYCPTCGGEVVLRSGEINVDHFAHISQCQDKWNYDMSEWHRKMQSHFPEAWREVVVKNNNEMHRADILDESTKTVIEFQHSSISAQEYRERTAFFTQLGYRVAWVFDLREKVEYNQIEAMDDNWTMFSWKNPMKIFNNWDKPSDNDKKFSLWFDLGSNCPDDNSFAISKVIWTPNDYYGETTFKRFMTSEVEIWFEDNDQDDWNTNVFFSSRLDRFYNAVNELKGKHKYSIKYKGIKGKPSYCYICPKSKQFGLQIFGETGCGYCRHCGLISEKIRGNVKEHQVYCCYPDVLYEKDCEPHDGYDYGDPTIYSI